MANSHSSIPSSPRFFHISSHFGLRLYHERRVSTGSPSTQTAKFQTCCSMESLSHDGLKCDGEFCCHTPPTLPYPALIPCPPPLTISTRQSHAHGKARSDSMITALFTALLTSPLPSIPPISFPPSVSVNVAHLASGKPCRLDDDCCVFGH